MIFYDTETCGFQGPIVLIQYAYDDGPIQLYCPWEHNVSETMSLIEEFMLHEGGTTGFNLSFDQFHLCQMYTTLCLLPGNELLGDLIEQYALKEKEARDGPCLKPITACDIMLHARKGPYQTLMNREDIRIKRVPVALVYALCNELEQRVKFNPIYFAKKKKIKYRQWEIYDIEDEDGGINPDFKDIVLKFAPSTALKALAIDALKIPLDNLLLFNDVNIDPPVELGYAPFALAIGEPGNWKGSWPDHIHRHIRHWTKEELPRRYARDDVEYTRGLYRYFGSPEPGDDDSVLACMVGACRWKGYNVNLEGIKKLKKESQGKIKDIPTYHEKVIEWIDPLLAPAEKLAIKGSTKKTLLKKLSTLDIDCDCTDGNGCAKCHGKPIPHPAALRAKLVLGAREAKYEIDFYQKLLLAGRLHADLNVIGAKSSRMSGGSDLNVQGIKNVKKIRSKFPLAFPPNRLSAGDFQSFEVVLAIAVWGDKKLEQTVTSYRECHKCNGKGVSSICSKCRGKTKIETEDEDYNTIVSDCNNCIDGMVLQNECFLCRGKGKVKTKIHALFGTYIYPHLSYEQILDSDGSEDDYYTRAKSGLFTLMYGGEAYTLATRLEVDEESAEIGYQKFVADYPVVGEARRAIFRQFQALSQAGGIGSKISWKDPADYIEEPILGHRRYFTLENRIIKALYDMASKPPKEWANIKIKVQRRDREQTVSGAVQSALYACAFMMQSSNCRAAANHVIQSAGAKITKYTQRQLWDLQPPGIGPFVVQPVNIHDELLTPHDRKDGPRIKETVQQAVEHFRVKVPLLAIDWNEGIKNWAEKK